MLFYLNKIGYVVKCTSCKRGTSFASIKRKLCIQKISVYITASNQLCVVPSLALVLNLRYCSFHRAHHVNIELEERFNERSSLYPCIRSSLAYFLSFSLKFYRNLDSRCHDTASTDNFCCLATREVCLFQTLLTSNSELSTPPGTENSLFNGPLIISPPAGSVFTLYITVCHSSIHATVAICYLNSFIQPIIARQAAVLSTL